jgi:hypothetical protein
VAPVRNTSSPLYLALTREVVLAVGDPLRRASRVAALAATIAILVATLRVTGPTLPAGWSFALTVGDTALAELIQNLLLFIPLGASLTLAGMRPLRAIAAGALLSFCVEFLQQWIPGRDPSAGDILCNTVSAGLGAGLVQAAPRWLVPAPRRSAWHAIGAAVLAVLIWLGTGLALRPTLPPPPHRVVTRADTAFWGGVYHGEVTWGQYSGGMLSVRAVSAQRPSHRAAPLAAVLGPGDVKGLVIGVDRRDLALRFHMPAVRLTLEQPDLRWRGALSGIAPGDSFIARAGHERGQVCLVLNDASRCGLGYTVGDGWKLIFYPPRFPPWLLVLINAIWVATSVLGVGFWAARATPAIRRLAVGIAVLGLVVVPVSTGLNGTPLWEWTAALVGIGAGFVAGNRVALLQRSGV